MKNTQKNAIVARAVLFLTLLVFAVPIFAASSAKATSDSAAESVANPETAVATFGAGCFWCVQTAFEKHGGVIDTEVGFMGGTTPNPSYKDVSKGGTGHIEVVHVSFDPTIISYGRILDIYWRNVDLLDGGGQFCDRGETYKSVIFTATPEQKAIAEASKTALAQSGRFDKPIATEIRDAGVFYPAEDYHQDYSEKNALSYQTYRFACGRNKRLKELWGNEAILGPKVIP